MILPRQARVGYAYSTRSDFMSPWVPIVVTVALAAIHIADGFYGRLVPIETQRAHLKRLIFWAVVTYDCAAVIFFIASLIHFSRTQPPLTLNTVFGIAWDFFGLTIIAVAAMMGLVLKLIGRGIEHESRNIEHLSHNTENIGRIIGALDKHLKFIKENFENLDANRKAIQLLASVSPEVTPGIADHLTTILTPTPKAPE